MERQRDSGRREEESEERVTIREERQINRKDLMHK